MIKFEVIKARNVSEKHLPSDTKSKEIESYQPSYLDPEYIERSRIPEEFRNITLEKLEEFKKLVRLPTQ